jgi:hypothetical protein
MRRFAIVGDIHQGAEFGQFLSAEAVGGPA